MNDQQAERLLALLGTIAGSLAAIERSLAPEAPNYRRDIAEFAHFDWLGIGARVIKSDDYGPSAVEWMDNVFTRRSPENKFGEAIWFSRPVGKDADGNNKYDRLITFKRLTDAEPISRSAERAIGARAPAPAATATVTVPVATSKSTPSATPTPATFSGPEQASAWGFEQGVFASAALAITAYNKLKAEHQPASADEMWALWIADVQARKLAHAAA